MEDKTQEKEKEKEEKAPQKPAQEDWDWNDFGHPGRTRDRRIARELGRDE